MGQKPIDSGDPPWQPLDAEAYSTYQPQIWRYMRSRMKTGADDYTADVFTRALVAQRNGNGARTHLRAWLFRIARSVLSDRARRQSRRVKTEPLTTAVILPSPVDLERDHLSHCAVESLIAHLSQDQLDLASRLAAGWTNDDLAHHYGISNLAARQRLVRLRQAIRSRMPTPQIESTP